MRRTIPPLLCALGLLVACDGRRPDGAAPVAARDPTEKDPFLVLGVDESWDYGAGPRIVALRPHGAPWTEASLGAIRVSGGLGEADARGPILARLPEIAGCFQWRPTAGAVSLRFAVAPSGRPFSVRAEGVDAELGACVADAVRDLRFSAFAPPPAPGERGDAHVEVLVPLVVRES